MSRVARLRAQAKINLRLRVLAREASGYHGIETIFQRLDWGDDVVVRTAAGRSLDCAGPAMPDGGLGPVEVNLAYRAAVAYADATGWPKGFAIEIVKHIPVGGGLGGGSADAGAVLRALDALAPRPLGPTLLEVAARLGADVPFLSAAVPTAIAWGHGERLMQIAAPRTRPVVLLVPAFSVSTAEAYGWVSAARGTTPAGALLLTGDSLAGWDALASLATNDFEPVVAARHPEVADLVAALASCGAAPAMLSGSGSTVFGVFDEVPDAAAIARRTGCVAIATATSERVADVVLDV